MLLLLLLDGQGLGLGQNLRLRLCRRSCLCLYQATTSALTVGIHRSAMRPRCCSSSGSLLWCTACWLQQTGRLQSNNL